MIKITWGDWFDDLAGLREYIYQIHTVSNRNNILKEDGPLKEGGEGTIHLNETFVSSYSVNGFLIIYHKDILPLPFCNLRMLLKNTTMKSF